MIELAQLFQDMETLVVQQEPMIQDIEQKGEEVTENVGKANEEISGAITKARSRNRKKWWCLLIVRMWSAFLEFPSLMLTSSSPHHYCRRRCGNRCCRNQQEKMIKSSTKSIVNRYNRRVSAQCHSAYLRPPLSLLLYSTNTTILGKALA
jgi:hypothetical protein